MKLTLKLILVVCLFSSIALADDGNMGNGGFADGNMSNGGKTGGDMGSGSFTEGNMGNGGRAVNDQSILDFIQNYLSDLFG